MKCKQLWTIAFVLWQVHHSFYSASCRGSEKFPYLGILVGTILWTQRKRLTSIGGKYTKSAKPNTTQRRNQPATWKRTFTKSKNGNNQATKWDGFPMNN